MAASCSNVLTKKAGKRHWGKHSLEETIGISFHITVKHLLLKNTFYFLKRQTELFIILFLVLALQFKNTYFTGGFSIPVLNPLVLNL